MLNIKSCDGACWDCIRGYKSKHLEEFQSQKKKPSFLIKCKGIPKEYVNESVAAKFADMEYREVLRLLDPVIWAEDNLDWYCLDPEGEVWKRKDKEEYETWVHDNPDKDIKGHSRYHRPYQAEMLRCTSKQKVFRIGRQAGKCLPSGTLIQMADGTQKPVELVKDGDLVVSVDEQYRTLVNSAFRACNGEKDVLRIALMDGREIEATYNHPFLSRKRIGRESVGARRAVFRDKWVEAGDLGPGDYLAVPRQMRLDLQERVADYHMTVLGCMIADGNVTGGNCRFSNTNREILDRLQGALSYFQCSLKQYESDAECDYHIVGQGIGKRHGVKDWFRALGLYGCDSHQKFVPDFFMTLADENIIELLRCMFACDGWACVRADGTAEIGYSTVSDTLADQVVALLARFGVYVTCQKKTVKLNGKKYLSRQLTITRKQSIENFRNKIGILGKEVAVEEVFRVSQAKGPSPKTEAYEDNDIAFIRVRSIEHVGVKMTWDLTVPKSHNFVANNIVTHNTECIVVSMLYHMVIRPGLSEDEGFKVVVIAPYQSQVDLIFTRLRELITRSPILKNSIYRAVKAPQYMIELNNGSKVTGFTAGTKSGSGAASARGQHAHMLVFDEADFLDTNDMDAAFSIITNHPDCKIWMSSTPIGKREKFYHTCHNPRWKEFFYPSSVNPLWSEELAATLREGLTSLGWVHEVKAEFGEMEQGVFQHAYIKAAQSGFNYGDFAPGSNWEFSIGVDWNDPANGTTIAVVGYNVTDGRYYLVDTAVVQREGWTQLKACQEIVRLNRFWNPFKIYLDKGHGGTQWELLRQYGFRALRDKSRGPKHPDAKLIKAHAYDFGSTVETRDPFTKQKIKKPAKGFLVENAVRFFENGLIRIPGSDQYLIRQLQGYVIDRISDTGRAIYKAGEGGDHMLDAVMLALATFALEKSAIGKPKFNSMIEFTPPLDTRDEPYPHAPQKPGAPSTRPDMNRAENIASEAPSELPASHTTRGGSGPGLRVWAWPGFLRDEPPPSSPLSKGRNGGMIRRGSYRSRPKRRNI